MQSAESLRVDTISAAEARTLPGLLQCRCDRTPDQPAYQQYRRDRNQWRTYSWQEIATLVGCWQKALQRENLQAGDRVAILHANSIEWVCFEQAALGLGLVVVPLYTWDSPENLAYLLRDSGSRFLLVGRASQWQPLIPYAASFPALQRVLCLEEQPLASAEGVSVTELDNWLGLQEEVSPCHPSDPDRLATIVYTSGTTGPPKGVMLSHRNILWNAEAILQVIECYTSDILLSFLPLSHTFERTAGYYTPMMAGSSVAFSRSMKELAEDLQIIRPTILISVPRIYEKVYARIRKKLQQKGGISRWLFRQTLAVGWHRFEFAQGRGSPLTLGEKLIWPLLRQIVADRILNRMGGRIRFAVSGGAPLQERVSRFFLSLGFPLIQGYGLTEAAPVISTNTPGHNIPDSVGQPLPGVRCRIGRENELLAKSPGLMLGYWNLPDKSNEVIDSQGWLHTGDVVEMEDGLIRIRGRLKEIIVTSTGEKVPPADLEMVIESDPLVEHVMVLGDGMPFLSALLALHSGEWEKLASACGRDPGDPRALIDPTVQQLVLEKLAELLHGFADYARIRSVGLLLDEWSIENGLLTPTLKLKRKAIESRYAEIIKGLYRGHEVPE